MRNLLCKAYGDYGHIDYLKNIVCLFQTGFFLILDKNKQKLRLASFLEKQDRNADCDNMRLSPCCRPTLAACFLGYSELESLCRHFHVLSAKFCQAGWSDWVGGV